MEALYGGLFDAIGGQLRQRYIFEYHQAVQILIYQRVESVKR